MKFTCLTEISLTAITFYNEQITKISKDIYPKDYLTKQIIQAKHFIDNHFADSIEDTHYHKSSIGCNFIRKKWKIKACFLSLI